MALPVQIGAPRWLRNYTGYGHPALSVPCPYCSAAAGRICVRPSGRRAPTMHVARRQLMMLLFLIDHGDEARLTHRSTGWEIERGVP